MKFTNSILDLILNYNHTFNFSNYLMQVRLGAAERLLVTTTMNISEISSACGFSGSNYFGDAFARFYGMAPSEYRKHTKE